MLCARLQLIVIVITVIIWTCKAVPPCSDTSICSCNQKMIICSCAGKQQQFIELQVDNYTPEYIVKINVKDCTRVTLNQRSIERFTSLREIRLENIRELTLEEKSFTWRNHVDRDGRTFYGHGLNVEIINCNVSKIPNYAFEGHLENILIDASKIHNVEAFAFSSLNEMQVLKIKNCIIDNFEQHSFKKFMVNHFVIEGGRVGVMNSYTIKDITVKKDLRFQGVDFGLVKSLAVTVEGPSAFRIQECVFEILETEAFKIYTKGPVFIDDNIIKDLRLGAFLGITLESSFFAHNDKQELVFENNTISKPKNDVIAFNTTALKPRIERLVLNIKCSCNDITNLQNKLVKYQGKQLITPDITKQTWCYDGTKEMTVAQYNDRKCKSSKTTLYIIIGLSVTAIVLLSLCIGGFIFYRKWKKMYKEVKTNRTNAENRLSTYSNTSNHVIVLPQPKMYLETEIDDCNEEVQPLKQSQNDLSKLKVTGL